MKKHVKQFHGRRMDPKSGLDNHVNMEIEKTMTYSCKKCESDFKNKNELNKHNAAHEEKKIFKCVTCSLTFTEKKLLGEHYTSAHEGGTVYLCPICNENFMAKPSLTAHIANVHRFKCDFCDATFNQNKNRTRHMQTAHEGTKVDENYKCYLCEATFTQQLNLTHHIASAHNEGNFKCGFCLKLFARKSTMTLHIEKFHGKIEINHQFRQPKVKIVASARLGDEPARHLE